MREKNKTTMGEAEREQATTKDPAEPRWQLPSPLRVQAAKSQNQPSRARAKGGRPHLGEVAIHSCGDAAFLVALDRAGGESNDLDVANSRNGRSSNPGCCCVAVQARHLSVHEAATDEPLAREESSGEGRGRTSGRSALPQQPVQRQLHLTPLERETVQRCQFPKSRTTSFPTHVHLDECSRHDLANQVVVCSPD